ncbi:hypothetical protein M8C21_022210 [Ambrosia artemisiifolia]|uniref:non-specific serine/threonine protein kinase n=1 Tax=Ambrosia artemisiifolia TaxID=4212 RepID=A0AAD5CPJ9_AMBAR|nr:hypothetical protein M8C21_022210 [Ambrosia artemisiifolia]
MTVASYSCRIRRLSGGGDWRPELKWTGCCWCRVITGEDDQLRSSSLPLTDKLSLSLYGDKDGQMVGLEDFRPSVSNAPPSTKKNMKNKTSLIVGILVPIAVFLGIDAKPYTFSYGDLRDVTDDFSPANKLGEGGFGYVYKGKAQFIAEIATISVVQHRNLVKLFGCCIEGDKRLLVYEYLENKSLDQALFGDIRLSLSWAARSEISLGLALGLAYLHEESQIRIIHRDVKGSNVLLDGDLNPKISDFGLAKLYDDKKTHLSTHVAGTIGYLAPEYALRGHLTEK